MLAVVTSDGLALPTAWRLPIASAAVHWGVAAGDRVVTHGHEIRLPRHTIRADALDRLNALVQSVAQPPRTRRATKPTYGSRQRRLQAKTQRGETKALRGKVRD